MAIGVRGLQSCAKYRHTGGLTPNTHTHAWRISCRQEGRRSVRWHGRAWPQRACVAWRPTPPPPWPVPMPTPCAHTHGGRLHSPAAVVVVAVVVGTGPPPRLAGPALSVSAPRAHSCGWMQGVGGCAPHPTPPMRACCAKESCRRRLATPHTHANSHRERLALSLSVVVLPPTSCHRLPMLTSGCSADHGADAGIPWGCMQAPVRHTRVAEYVVCC